MKFVISSLRIPVYAMLAVIAIAALTLPGCATVGAANAKIAQDVQNIVAPIQQTTLADAQAALAIAKQAGDTDGAKCYQAIADYLQTPAASVPVINGVLSGLEAARTFSAPSIPKAIHSACAVLVVDAQQAAIKLGLNLAPIVGGGVKVQAGAAAVKAEAGALKAAEAAAHP